MDYKRKFFRIDDASADHEWFARAMGFGPLDDAMPFFLPGQLEREREFWNKNPMAPGLYVEDGEVEAREWPDFLGHGGGFPAFFVSDKVINCLAKEGVDIARKTAMPIAEVSCKGLDERSSPSYFVLEALHAMEMDYRASGVPVGANGRPVLPLPKAPNWKLKLSSWSGNDLFAWPNIWSRPSCSLVCTERIVKLSEQEGWTNCRFTPIWGE